MSLNASMQSTEEGSGLGAGLEADDFHRRAQAMLQVSDISNPGHLPQNCSTARGHAMGPTRQRARCIARLGRRARTRLALLKLLWRAAQEIRSVLAGTGSTGGSSTSGGSGGGTADASAAAVSGGVRCLAAVGAGQEALLVLAWVDACVCVRDCSVVYAGELDKSTEGSVDHLTGCR